MHRFLRKVVPGGLAAAYLESEWSFAQVRGVHAPTICAFGKTPNTVVSVGADGAFLVSRFADGGECERVAFHRFIKSKEEEEFDVCPSVVALPSICVDAIGAFLLASSRDSESVRRSRPGRTRGPSGRVGPCTRLRSRRSPGLCGKKKCVGYRAN